MPIGQTVYCPWGPNLNLLDFPGFHLDAQG